MGARSRRTGATFERQVARWLTAASGVRWRRTLPGETQAHCGDVRPDTQPDGWPLLHVECKAHASVVPAHLLWPTETILGWWRRCCDEALERGAWPWLFVRFKGRGVALIAPAGHWVEAKAVPAWTVDLPAAWRVRATLPLATDAVDAASALGVDEQS